MKPSLARNIAQFVVLASLPLASRFLENKDSFGSTTLFPPKHHNKNKSGQLASTPLRELRNRNNQLNQGLFFLKENLSKQDESEFAPNGSVSDVDTSMKDQRNFEAMKISRDKDGVMLSTKPEVEGGNTPNAEGKQDPRNLVNRGQFHSPLEDEDQKGQRPGSISLTNTWKRLSKDIHRTHLSLLMTAKN
ncbi:hypothetical protein PROFUN_16763 [Planoprotostelium fungivorum]|uniref:Uncharacterized protein n=1 Tax=Planoprotostelium fungivorum TaxID=1890364 RepID=A0A2P6MPH7_9EUKA|nr:hypothetical protein PROFUN_16763 [Planoprotostelium fungivorum]